MALSNRQNEAHRVIDMAEYLMGRNNIVRSDDKGRQEGTSWSSNIREGRKAYIPACRGDPV